MRVQFDLRPAGLVEKERKKTGFNLIRIVITLFFLAFLVTCGFYIWKMGMKMVELRDSIDAKESDLVAIEAQQMQLNVEVRRLQDREKQYASTLKIMQDDLATLEVLNALETHMDWGIGLTSIRMSSTTDRQNVTQNVVLVTATAAEQEQTTRLADALAGSGVFSGVSVTDTARDEATGRVKFTLNLNVFPIGQIGPRSN